MKRDLVAGVRIAAIVIGWIAATLAGTSAAMADPNCNEFFSNSDGSWSPSHPIVIGGPTSQTRIGPSAAFEVPALQAANSVSGTSNGKRR